MKKICLFVFILVIALLLRFLNLDKVPIELFGDELDAGYQAYSVLKTGKDIRGYKYPFYFHSLSESKAPVYLYATVPFVAIFGLNPWGVRLPAAIFGIISILLIFLLSRELFKDKRISWLSFILITILPWHIQYSRAAFEETLLLSLVLSGIYFFFLSFKNKNFLLLSIAFFCLSVYTYPTAVIFVPLIFLSLAIIFKKEILLLGRKIFIFSFLFLALCSIPFFRGFFQTGQSQERFFKISIFSNNKSIENIINKRKNNSFTEKFFHNKLTEYSFSFLENYLTSFSPQFLFLNGDPSPRQNSGRGEMLWQLVPFLIIGLFEIFKNIKEKKYKFLLCWLLISPIPSCLTIEGGNHAGRLFLMIAPLVLIIGLGLAKLFERKSLLFRLMTLIVFSTLLLSIVFYLHQYYYHYPKDSWQYWQYGYEQIFKKLKQIDSSYSKVVINNNHDPVLLRFLFWTKADPTWLRQNFVDDKTISEILPGFDGFNVGKYYFGSFNDKTKFTSSLNKETLYLVFQKDEIPGDWDWSKSPPSGIKVLELVKNPLGDPYIYLLSSDK